MIAAILFVSFAILLILGTPIAVCLGSSSVLAMLVQGAGRPFDTIMSSLPFLFSASSSKFVLLAIPFFILAGNIMEKAGISERLINLAEACVGHVKGGLAIVCAIVACFFAPISGSGRGALSAKILFSSASACCSSSSQAICRAFSLGRLTWLST